MRWAPDKIKLPVTNYWAPISCRVIPDWTKLFRPFRTHVTLTCLPSRHFDVKTYSTFNGLLSATHQSRGTLPRLLNAITKIHFSLSYSIPEISNFIYVSQHTGLTTLLTIAESIDGLSNKLHLSPPQRIKPYTLLAAAPRREEALTNSSSIVKTSTGGDVTTSLPPLCCLFSTLMTLR